MVVNNKKNYFFAIFSILIVFITAVYFWLALGLSGLLNESIYFFLLLGLISGSLPILIGVLKKNRKIVFVGFLSSMFCAGAIIFKYRQHTALENGKSHEMIKKYRSQIIANAKEVLHCENGYTAFYSINELTDKTTIQSLELQDTAMQWPPEILCIKRGKNKSICRGLDRRTDLKCSSEKFKNIIEIKKFYFQ